MGKITVICDIMLENYRGGWRDMGSVQIRDGVKIENGLEV